MTTTQSQRPAELTADEKERELYKTPECLKDSEELTHSSLDDRPTNRRHPTLREKLDGFGRFTAALRNPANAAVAGPFIKASAALFIVPLVIFNVMFRIVLPAMGFGDDVPIDQAVALGMDRVTLSGVCALTSCWAIMIAYTVHAVLEKPPTSASSNDSAADARKTK